MEAKLTFKYDREADILHIDKRPPYAEQESEELPDEIIARRNPDTGEVESLEEGLEETSTINRLGLPPQLWQLFASANIIESCFSRAGGSVAWGQAPAAWEHGPTLGGHRAAGKPRHSSSASRGTVSCRCWSIR
jgi:hypothetical protein